MNMGPDRVQSGAYDLQSLQQQLQMIALQRDAAAANMKAQNIASIPNASTGGVAQRGGDGKRVFGGGTEEGALDPRAGSGTSGGNYTLPGMSSNGFLNPQDPAQRIAEIKARLFGNQAARSDYQMAMDFPWSSQAAKVARDTRTDTNNINYSTLANTPIGMQGAVPASQGPTGQANADFSSLKGASQSIDDMHKTASDSVADAMSKLDFYRKAPASSEFIKQFPTAQSFLNSGLDLNHLSIIQQNKGIPDSFLAQLENSRHMDLQRSGGSAVDTIKLLTDLNNLQNSNTDTRLKNPKAGDTVPWLGANYTYKDPRTGASLERDPEAKKLLNDKSAGEIDLTGRAFNLANKIDGDLSQGVPLSSLSARGNELSQMAKELKAKLRDSGLYNSSRLSEQTMNVMDGLADNPVGFLASYKGKEELGKSYRRLGMVNILANDALFESKGIHREHFYDSVTGRMYDSLSEIPNARPDAIVRMSSNDPKGSQAALEKLGVI